MTTLEDMIRASVSTREEAREILDIVDRGEGSMVQHGESVLAWRRFPDRLHIMTFAGRLADLEGALRHLASDMLKTGIGNITWDGRPAWSRIAERFRNG